MDELKALRDILNDMDMNEPYLADTEPDAAADWKQGKIYALLFLCPEIGY